MAAILDFARKRGFPQERFGRDFCVSFYSPTESNYVEKHLLTFISIKYLGMQIIHILRLIILP